MTLYLFWHWFSAGDGMFGYNRWFFELNIFQGSFCHTNLWLNLRFVAVARNEIEIGTRICKSRSIHSHAWFKLYRTLCVANSIFILLRFCVCYCLSYHFSNWIASLTSMHGMCKRWSLFLFLFLPLCFVYIVYVRLDDCNGTKSNVPNKHEDSMTVSKKLYADPRSYFIYKKVLFAEKNEEKNPQTIRYAFLLL